MPSKRYNRQVALLEPAVETKLVALSDQHNLPVARLLRMAVKYIFADKKRLKEFLEFGDPHTSKE